MPEISESAAATRRKLVIVGAGAVGTTIAYAAMMEGLTREILLTDINTNKAEAEAKDLMHGSPFLPRVDVRSGGVEDSAGAQVVVLTAGAKQKPGQTRLQLLETNVAILRDLVPRILKAAPDALLLMVSNPVDVLTYVAWKLSGLPRERVIGSGTVLDSARFRALLSQRLGIAASNIHAYIVGEHGDSEVAIWSSAHVGNTPLLEFHHSGMERLREEEKEPIFAGVRDAAQHVIAAKGATNWAIGVAVARILEVILRDEHAVFTISSLIQGWNGIDDVCLSLPTLMSARGAGDVLPLGLDSRELAALRHSAQILKDACRSLGF